MQLMPKSIAVMVLAACATLVLIEGLPTPARASETGSATAASSERRVVFSVEKMTCAACPLTVRKAMQSIAGVKSVDVDFEARTATVVYDPALATAEQIAAASANAGYPAEPIS